MSQAFFTSIAGITAAQSNIDVVADNIANMNTVAFKSSDLNFQTVYSRLISGGTSPSSETGGTNPTQVGLGVTIGSITRDFSNGTIQSTGRTSDLNIQGDGFFTLAGDAGTLLTRAGNFSLDTDGNLVTSDGIKVLGTDSIYSQYGGSTTVKVPPTLKLVTSGKDLTQPGNDTLSDLNNASITEGTFVLNVTDSSNVTHAISVDTTGDTTLSDIADSINTAINSYDSGRFNGAIVASRTSDGKFQLDLDTSGTGSPSSIAFEAGTSNFINESGLASATETTTGSNVNYTSNTLSYQVDVGSPDNINTSASVNSYSIGIDGAIEVSYSNGDKISVETVGNKKALVYTTGEGVTIHSSDINVLGSGVIEPANLQLQMASVVNEEGLISQGSNVYKVGPNSGEPTYSIANANGFGSIASGGLESSNVDLPSQFADMILAQRAIDANSRTFQAMNQIMQRLVMLGR